MKQTSTRTKYGGSYPNEGTLIIRWTEDDDGHGYTGTVIVFPDRDTKEEREYTVNIRQAIPLGNLHIDFESVGYGCWASGTFPGVSLTERDLQWATLWVVPHVDSYKAMLARDEQAEANDTLPPDWKAGRHGAARDEP